jgi:hypothetical protein
MYGYLLQVERKSALSLTISKIIAIVHRLVSVVHREPAFYPNQWVSLVYRGFTKGANKQVSTNSTIKPNVRLHDAIAYIWRSETMSLKYKKLELHKQLQQVNQMHT